MKSKISNFLDKINSKFSTIILVSVFSIFFTLEVFAFSVVLNYFNAKTDGRNVTIEWKANNEDRLRFYELERAEDNANYVKIYRQVAKGNTFNYRFVDEDALKESLGEVNEKINTTQQNKSYSYRLKMLFEDGSSKYSDVTFVSQNVNSVRRTWGMIKEMFR